MANKYMEPKSITKLKLTANQIHSAVKKAFHNQQTVHTFSELTGGCFNASYSVTLNDDTKIVLKVAPPSDVTVMHYEQNLIDTEVAVLEMLAKLDSVPVPKLITYDTFETIIPSSYFIMEHVSGAPLDTIRESLSEEKLKKISIQLAAISTGINSIESDFFGSITPNGRRNISWYDEFYAMINDLVLDAKMIGFSLPYDPDDILKIVSDHSQILNEISTPRLVHKDLWDGNIFVNKTEERITGIIDCERALYGDPLLDVVCGFLQHNRNFLLNRFGKDSFNDKEQGRIRLYRLYLFLLMTIEQPYRKTDYGGSWPREQLKAVMKEFNQS
ncbi:MAG: aminoglycoside phosphotransferase family protein [Spirochaetes bacterium]|jgi:aminoglycoside phosphotransferase (APT) family kinase protein|nr:aminoglycoside phosphotransferase family protein [Spirochaetota bacterium]